MKHYNIPIFVPHKGCLNDCVFCNQKRITGTLADITTDDIEKTIEEYLKTLPKNDRIIEVAFFGGSFTGIDFDVQGQFLSAAHKYIKSGLINGIRLSTRPDYINNKVLDQLKKFDVTTIELGVQSLDENVLIASNRGHSVEDVYSAVKLIREYGFSLGLQMMTGLPADTDEISIETAKKIISLKPDFVRIYPTLVLKDTKLEDMYNCGEYLPQELNCAVSLCKKLVLMFLDANIPVIRISLQTTDEISPNGSLIAGPFDPQFRELVESEIYFDKFLCALNEKSLKDVVISVNTKELSKAIGPNKSNIDKFKKNHDINLKIVGDDKIKTGDFCIINN